MTRNRLLWFAATMVLLVGLSSYLLTRNTRAEVRAGGGPAPGFESETRDRAEGPFELAAPSTTEGPTTIPGGPGAERRTTTTTEPDTATTTTIAPIPLLKPSDEITTICGLDVAFESMTRIFTDPTVDVQGVATAFLANMQGYARAAPPELAGDVAGMRDVVAAVELSLRNAGWNAADQRTLTLVSAVRTGLPPYQDFPRQRVRIREYEAASCPKG